MTNILFATNRQRLPDTAAGVADFGDTTAQPGPGGLLYATAAVAGIITTQADSGTITQISNPNPGIFADADLRPVLESQNDVLVFVHGCANGFQDAIKRAAYNKEWLGAAAVPGVDTVLDVIAFTWPARSYTIANIVGDYTDYRHDQSEARASAAHFCLFLQQIQALRQRLGNRRLNLLCHSMGNYMLGGAVEALFTSGAAPATPLFDEVILAAADETATSFSTPNGGRLTNLWRLGREITVYFNNDDIAMALSHIVNQDFRLGYDGPPNAADTGFFSRNVYEFVDCTGVDDYINSILQAPDRSHQYYRQSPTVRSDIVTTLAGATPVRPRYDGGANIYSLFPPA
ncbi:MAG: alpha/beta hydrolase [Rhodopila sp.]|nr:alpha/beta hydrolase [Rhodopila sp.]